MFRSVRRIAALVVVVVVVLVVALVVTGRPQLARAHDKVESRWADLRPELDARYEALAGVSAAVAAVPGPERSITADVDGAWDRWQAGGSVGEEVATANELEGLARRMLTNVSSSAVVRETPAVQQALTTFLGAAMPAGATEFNEVVADYDNDRNSARGRLLAGPFGFEEIPALDLTRAPEAAPAG